MQFSVRHLLFLTALVAIFATALVNPNHVWAAVVRIISWAIYAQLIVTAAKRKSIRLAFAVVTGVSYVIYSSWWYQDVWPIPAPAYFRSAYRFFHGGSGDFNTYANFIFIVEYVKSFVFALAGGLFGALVARK